MTLRISHRFRMFLLAFCCITFAKQKGSYAQSVEKKLLDSAEYVTKMNGIKSQFPKIEYKGSFAVSFFAALEKYPELTDIRIIFKFRNVKTTMQCRPCTFSVIRKAEKRKFVMVFNKNKGNTLGVPLNKLSFNARVGLFAHELAHIVDYQTRSSFDIVKLGYAYLFQKGKISLEHQIDRIVIWKGFGWQLYAFAQEVANSKRASQCYLVQKKKIYLQPRHIRQLIAIVENISWNVD